MIAIAVLSALLAIMQNALSLAVLGVSGGFLAPVLASTGGGSHVMLFTYYGVLNLGILAIALTDHLVHVIFRGDHRIQRDLVDQSFGE